MINQLIKAFLLIFFAELGDKSQIIAMTFATKYKIKTVITGIFIGTFLNHILAVLLGIYLSNFISFNNLQIIASFFFIVFGILTIANDEEDDEDFKKDTIHPIITIAFLFFIGELGDKTQLATIALATDSNYPIFTFLGTVSGMVATSILGIIVGMKLGKNIPEFLIKVLSSGIFIIFGFIKIIPIIDNLYLKSSLIFFVSIIYFFFIWKYKSKDKLSRYKIAAQNLKNYKKELNNSIQDTCLTTKNCGVCEKNNCLIGQLKYIINNNNLNQLDNEFKNKFTNKQLLFLLSKVLIYLNNIKDENEVKKYNLIRKKIELVIFNESFAFENISDYLSKIKKIDREVYK
ncbi:MAG: TMEM165/GDT1 family protein, partial [Bacillota bacterium]